MHYTLFIATNLTDKMTTPNLELFHFNSQTQSYSCLQKTRNSNESPNLLINAIVRLGTCENLGIIP